MLWAGVPGQIDFGKGVGRMKPIAVVTGGSSGFGREFVKQLLQTEIQEIWVIARDPEKLHRLQKDFKNKIRIFSLDLSDLCSIETFSHTLAKESPDIRWLINNAGYAKFCSYCDLDIRQSANMISLNAIGTVSMGLCCIPYMRRGAHILNIASQSAFFPLPYLNLYSATKAFILHYSQALRTELKDKGVGVTAVCPGWMDTGLYARANIGVQKAPSRFTPMFSPDKVAKKALRDAQKNKAVSMYGVTVRFSYAAAKLLPQKIITKMWLSQQNLNEF